MAPLTSWSTRAINLPDHATNRIHTDEGGRAAGFDGALVAGVTTYVYLTHPPLAAWGLHWLEHGSAHVRFHAPVLDQDLVRCDPAETAEGTTIEARVDGTVRATCVVAENHTDTLPVPLRGGDALATTSFVLSDLWATYATRAGDDLALLADGDLVHPALWPRLANELVHQQLVEGPWIHTRSRVEHHGPARAGTSVEVSANVLDRFSTRSGERAIVDVRMHTEGRLLAAVEHEALVSLH